MSRKENEKSQKASKKSGFVKGEREDKKPLFSARQKKVLLIILIAMFILVPVIDVFRCKAACLKRIKTPYPEIACKYDCPWPWERK
jgi:uncharacterized ion transporter superfamily protein YfcC